MAVIGGLAIIYRIVVICAPGVRNQLISYRVLVDDRDKLQEISEKLSYPDWFVLRRLSDNINRIRFGELIQSIHEYMPGRPRSPVLSPIDASAPDPYRKGDEYGSNDPTLPLIKQKGHEL